MCLSFRHGLDWLDMRGAKLRSEQQLKYRVMPERYERHGLLQLLHVLPVWRIRLTLLLKHNRQFRM
jgi:hypothetical protein